MVYISTPMATQSSDLDDQMSGATIHMEVHTLTAPNSPKEIEGIQ